MTTWLELAALPEGSRLRFKDAFDIFPDALVPPGTYCTIVENGLNEIWSAMLVRPDNEQIQEELREWKGCVHVQGPAPEGPEEDPKWKEESPFEAVPKWFSAL